MLLLVVVVVFLPLLLTELVVLFCQCRKPLQPMPVNPVNARLVDTGGSAAIHKTCQRIHSYHCAA